MKSSRLPTSPQSTMHTRNPVYKESEEQSLSSTLTSQQQNNPEDTKPSNGKESHRRLFFLNNELNVSQIIDNPKVASV